MCLYNDDGKIIGNGFRLYNRFLITAMHVSDVAETAGLPGTFSRIKLPKARYVQEFDFAYYRISDRDFTSLGVKSLKVIATVGPHNMVEIRGYSPSDESWARSLGAAVSNGPNMFEVLY